MALFENLLFSATEDSKSKSLGWYSKKKASTYTVYYRKQANFEKEEVSEQKIEKAIIRKGLFDAAKDVEYWESVVRGLLTKNYSDITRVTLNQLRGELVFAERYRSELSDHIDYLLSKPSGDDKKDENLIRGLNSQLRIQNSIILRINKEMTELLSMA